MTQNEKQCAQRLTELVLKNVPRSYATVLREQISISQVSVQSWEYGYKVLFACDHNSPQLPPWLPLKCFEWQCLTQEAPITCEVFLDTEYRIAEIFVLDYSFEVLRWDVVWNKDWHPSCEYDASKLVAKFSNASLLIKETAVGTIAGQIVAKINVAQNEDDAGTVLNFCGCENNHVDFPTHVLCIVSIVEVKGIEDFIVVYVDGQEIVRCKAVYEIYDNLLA